MQNGGYCENDAKKKTEKQAGASGFWDDDGYYHSNALTADSDSTGFYSYLFLPFIME